MGGSQYSRVCGRALAYRFGWIHGFLGYDLARQGIDGQYVDGLSLTHGVPGSRQHVWTFASGQFTGSSSNAFSISRCPCDNGNTTYPSSSFVGNDYFCESVLTTRSSHFASAFQMLHSGMARFVRVVAHAASSTIHHGSPRT